MEQKTTELINLLLETLKNSNQFVIEQMPDVLRQLITRELYQSAFLSITFFIFLLLSIYLIILGLKILKKENDCGSCDCNFIPLFVIGGALFPITLTISICNIYDFISVYIAPKAFLFDYLLKLINK